jgi:hypothetical protein
VRTLGLGFARGGCGCLPTRSLRSKRSPAELTWDGCVRTCIDGRSSGVPGVAGARLEERARLPHEVLRPLTPKRVDQGFPPRAQAIAPPSPGEIRGPHLDALSGMSDPAIFNRGRLLHHAMAPGPREQLGERNEQ